MTITAYLHDHLADDVLRYCYIISAICFVLGLKGSAHHVGHAAAWLWRHSAWPRRRNVFHHHIVNYTLIGPVLSAPSSARRRSEYLMTAVPQRTVLSHSLEPSRLSGRHLGHIRFQGELDCVT
jgi:hypothetical protein